MTKQASVVDVAALPEKKAGAPEITPAMIGAGVSALAAVLGEERLVLEEIAVDRVYRAMRALEPQ
jgi:hypothetical protein